MWNEYDDDDDGEHLERRRWSVPSRRELTPPRTTRPGTLNDEPPAVEDLQPSTTEPSVATMAPVAQPKARATAAATAVTETAADRQMSDSSSKALRAALDEASAAGGVAHFERRLAYAAFRRDEMGDTRCASGVRLGELAVHTSALVF